MVSAKENTYLRIKPAGSLESGKLTLDVKQHACRLQRMLVSIDVSC